MGEVVSMDGGVFFGTLHDGKLMGASPASRVPCCGAIPHCHTVIRSLDTVNDRSHNHLHLILTLQHCLLS